MLNPQIMQAKVTLAKTEKEYKETKLHLVRVINELSQLINPYFGDDIERIRAEEIEQAGDELLVLKNAAIQQKELIKTIKEDIGEV